MKSNDSLEDVKLRKARRIGSKIALILGILVLLSSGVNNNDTSNLMRFATGNVMIFGSLAYIARRKLNEQSSSKWRAIEAISILIVLFFTLRGVFSGGWYSDPVPYLISPVWFAVAYMVAFMNGRKTSKIQSPKNQQEDLSNLEKLAELRDKGIITEKEFTAKKKKVLQI